MSGQTRCRGRSTGRGNGRSPGSSRATARRVLHEPSRESLGELEVRLPDKLDPLSPRPGATKALPDCAPDRLSLVARKCQVLQKGTRAFATFPDGPAYLVLFIFFVIG